ncbi:MAG: hypothetical protein J6C23_02510 [Clostridia bacterium]|nr:hypothetical protein [Clostridia bacterium]
MRKASKLLMFLASITVAVTLVGCAQPHSHTFSSDCDTTCNTCEHTREVGVEHTATDDGDCTTAVLCELCGEVKIEAKSAHTPEADDGDCTTAVECSECDKNAVEAKEAHTPEADDGDCTTAVKCSECDKNAVEAKSAHTPEADDGDCTTAVECTECDKNAVEAKDAHTPATDDGDCTTAVECLECDKNAVEAKDAHTPGEDDGDCATAIKCSDCDLIAVEAKDAHEFGADDGKCVHCETVAVAKVGDVFYIDFNEALSNWAEGTTLTLYKDIASGTVSETIEVMNKSVTLDLNGHTLDMNPHPDAFRVGNISVEHEDGERVETVIPGTLTILDSKNSGSINSKHMSIVVCGTLNLKSGTIERMVTNYGTLNMTGGKIVGMTGDGLVHAIRNLGTVNISGGTLMGYYGIYNFSADCIVNISGSPTIEGKDWDTSNQGASIYCDGNVSISGTPNFIGAGRGVLSLATPVTLNTQPADGEVWGVYMDSSAITENNVVFAIPGEGVVLDETKFVSVVEGYEVTKLTDGSLALTPIAE